MDLDNSSNLSPLDWLMPRSYINQLLYFPLSGPSAAQTLRDGLFNLLSDIPYLAYSVLDHSSPKQSATLGDASASLDELFSVVDMRQNISYDALRATCFAPSAVALLKCLSLDENAARCQAVFRATLALLSGGCILSMHVHHSTTDITGFGALLDLWASHCRNGTAESVHFTRTCLDRYALFNASHGRVRRMHDCPPALLHWDQQTSTNTQARTVASSSVETSIFKFPAAFLRQLKNDVLKSLAGEVPWVSTLDILTALLWSTVVMAEIGSNSGVATSEWDKKGSTHFLRIPVNFRGLCVPPLPRHYLGAAFGVSLAQAEEKDLMSIATHGREHSSSTLIQAVARVAAAVRTAILAVDDKGIKAAAEYTAAQDDLTGLKLGPQPAKASIVSWAAENVYELDWGQDIGRCESVRLPEPKRQRYPIILPRLANGDFEVLVSFEPRMMDSLRRGWVMNLGKE